MNFYSMYTLMKQKYKKHKRLKYLMVICACFVLVFRLCLLKTYRNDGDVSSKVIKRYIPEQSVHEPKRNKTNIFFIETSCFNQSVTNIVTPHQACAIESAAAGNPNNRVYLFYTCSFDRYNLPFEDDYLNRLFLFPNLRFLRLNITSFVKGTPMEDWWAANAVIDSSFTIAHLSDLLRFVTLWKYGGTYMDFDFVTLRSLNSLSNFIGDDSRHSLSNGMMNFEPDGIGHEIVSECLEEMKRSFNGSVWAIDASAVVTRVLSTRCGVSEPAEMTKDRCGGFSVLPPKTFFPIPQTFWQLYFNQKDPEPSFLQSILDKSVAVNTWNKLSGDALLNVGSNWTYAVLAEKYCPKTYNHCGPLF